MHYYCCYTYTYTDTIAITLHCSAARVRAGPAARCEHPAEVLSRRCRDDAKPMLLKQILSNMN